MTIDYLVSKAEAGIERSSYALNDGIKADVYEGPFNVMRLRYLSITYRWDSVITLGF